MKLQNVFAWFKKKQIYKSCLIRQEARTAQMFSSVLMPQEALNITATDTVRSFFRVHCNYRTDNSLESSLY